MISIIQNTKYQPGGNGSTVPLTLSSTPIVGSILIAFIGYSAYTGDRTVTPPSDWVEIDKSYSGNAGLAVYWHEVVEGDTALQTFTVSGANDSHSGVMYELSGVDLTSPIDNHSIVTGTAVSFITTTGITPSVLSTFGLSGCATNNGSNSGFSCTGVSANNTLDESAIPVYHSTFGSHKDDVTDDIITSISNTFTFSGSATDGVVASMILLKPSSETLTIDETATLDDSWNLDTNPKQINFNEEVDIDDSWDLVLNPGTITIDETATLDDSWSLTQFSPTDYISTIISYNPLVYVTNTDPASITEVDITDPTTPIKTVYEIVGCKNATGLLLNDSNDYFYITCAEGKVAKIEKANLNNQTVIDTVETDDLTLIDSIDDYFQTFVATDNTSGELIMIDERTIESINTDLRFLQEKNELINVWINTILGKLINTDLRFLSTSTTSINTDLRWLKYSYTSISKYPINQTSDWQIKINNVDMVALDDVNMKSIKIIHTIDNDSTAVFILNRVHDKLNYTHTEVASEITNNNIVKIYIKNNLEFDGKISNISVNSDNETVSVTAIASQPTSKKNDILIPLSDINENIHLYHCLADNIIIDNPPLLITGAVITNSDGMYWSGIKWVGRISDAYVYATHTLAQTAINENSKWDNFTSAEIYPTNASGNIQYYKGIAINLGTKIEESVTRLNSFRVGGWATEIENGTFEPEQNWNYFWSASFENFITKLSHLSVEYLGTSLGSLSSDTFKATFVNYKRQRIYDDIETDLGWYYIGDAPYNEISSSNGLKLSKFKWDDRDDGLYEIKDESYNYVDYAKRVAELEYEKIKNINGDILPITNGAIEISIDGYYYYGIKLLSKINIDNTNTLNIYNKNNGFPLGVKSITIDSQSMKVICQCDNQLSLEEINEIDNLYPNKDDYIVPETATKIHSKFDVNKWGYIL